MVDAVVSFVVNKLGDFLLNKAILLGGVYNEVAWLKKELECMQRFLKDAEDKQYEDAEVCRWVSAIRDLTFDIEDLLDTFHLKVHGEAASDDVGTMERKPQSVCFPSLSSCIFCKGNEQVNLYKTGKEIEDLKSRMKDLTRRRDDYQLQESRNSGEGSSNAHVRSRDIRRSSSFAVEQNVVGFEDDAQKLLDKLSDNDPQRLIISIYGMGGLGKTTLAGKLYHNSTVGRRFVNCCAWVSVSKDYTTVDLLVRLIKSFGFGTTEMEDPEKMNKGDQWLGTKRTIALEKNTEDLERYLFDSLQNQPYLVVLDDVWDKEVWKSLKRAFPDNKNGSRVIITTRDKNIAQSFDVNTHAHNLRNLRPDESWQLFCEKAFQKVKQDEGLEKLGKEMVKKCNGLPLAIIVLGGLLSIKEPQQWREVHNHLWKHLKDDDEIRFVLALSFDGLSHTLKQCFLYLGLFPEDFEINMEKLIHLFVAEGFIPPGGDLNMEEAAKGCLEELISRSLIQVEKRYWGRISTIRVHDLLRDLAIEKAKTLNSLYIYDEVKNSDLSPTITTCPRQALYSAVERSSWLKQCNPCLRTLFLFDKCQHMESMCKKFSSLRLLNCHAIIDKKDHSVLDKEIGKLIHVKYLGLRDTSFRLSSSSIFNLRRLQTLDVYGSDWRIELPAEIRKLQELRHLIGMFTNAPIDSLENLQTLRYVQLSYWDKINTEKLVNLRELRFFGSVDEFSFKSMSNLKRLRILSVVPYYGKPISFASLQPLSHCENLVELRLKGKMEKLPGDIDQLLPNLECLSLTDSQLTDDPMPILEKLPYLMTLHLGSRFYSGKKIMCSAKGFPWLQILLIDEIEDLHVEENALPRLRGLRIPDNTKLIPESLRSIPTPDPREYTNKSLDDEGTPPSPFSLWLLLYLCNSL
ncbi:hypothetical protein QYF36_004998 [Acer negundo]|nr:hypothetical protein QYF36_004998 [Acer negundo]